MDPLEDLVASLPLDHPLVALRNGHARGKSGPDVLRKLRHSKNLTQAELANMLYVTQERVSALERGGVSRVQIGTLRRYVEALGGSLHVEIELDGKRIDITAKAAASRND
jgi:transcriptional regulator with XRE-family HTH domain